MLKTIAGLLLVTTVVAAQDSPLVALAKRTNRKAGRTPVITNATVASSRGRISLASGDPSAPAPLPAALAAPSAAVPAPQRAGVSTVPRMPADPPTTARNIEPQSSARTIAPVSTVRTIAPTSGVANIAPQSTAGTVQPASTARNIVPQVAKPPQQ